LQVNAIFDMNTASIDLVFVIIVFAPVVVALYTLTKRRVQHGHCGCPRVTSGEIACHF